MKKKPPGPRSWLPGGSLPAMQRNPLTFLSGLAREYGDAVSVRFGPQRTCFFNHPDLVREVLVTRERSFAKGRVLKRTKVLLGEGLLTSEGAHHMRQRRLAQPAFHRERIQRYGEVMVAHTDRAAARWQEGVEIDIAQEMMRLTLGVVAMTLFGTAVEEEAGEISEALTEVMEMFPLLLNPMADILRHFPFPPVRRMKRAIARLDKTIYRIIAERRRTGVDQGDLLSMLLMARDVDEGTGGMTDQQVRDEAITLFLAGHETTANALTWTWYLLMQHPEIERRLHQHLEEVLGGRAPQPSDYPRLSYVEMIFAEAMRLYPPAWSLGRLALEDLAIGDWEVSRGTVVIVSQWTMHRDTRFWPDPERFDPDRFSPANKTARPRFAYFPFGAGSRICIGESFAWMEGVLILAAIAQRWRFELARTTVIEPHALITLRPKTAVNVIPRRA